MCIKSRFEYIMDFKIIISKNPLYFKMLMITINGNSFRLARVTSYYCGDSLSSERTIL